MRRATQRGFSIPSEPWEQKSLAPYFALVSVLLLAALVGAIVLAKKD